MPASDVWMCRLWLLLGIYLLERSVVKNMGWQRNLARSGMCVVLDDDEACGLWCHFAHDFPHR